VILGEAQAYHYESSRRRFDYHLSGSKP